MVAVAVRVGVGVSVGVAVLVGRGVSVEVGVAETGLGRFLLVCNSEVVAVGCTKPVTAWQASKTSTKGRIQTTCERDFMFSSGHEPEKWCLRCSQEADNCQ